MKNVVQQTSCFSHGLNKADTPGPRGFTLIEVATALMILSMIGLGVVVVMNRLMDTVIDWQMKTEAFRISREHMENILAKESVSDMVEFGVGETNADISWTKTVESFYEPVTNRMWMRAICSAEYVDTAGEEQKVELIHWLNALSKEQMLQILDQMQRAGEYASTVELLEWMDSLSEEQIYTMAEQLDAAEELSESSSVADWVDELDSEQLARLKDQMNKQREEYIRTGLGPEDFVPDIDLSEPLPEDSESPTEPDPEAEGDEWDMLYKLLGPPPEPYETWPDVPDDVFWARIAEYLRTK